MTIEIGTAPPAPKPEQAAAMRQVLLEAIRRGEGGAPLLRAMLSDVKLSPDQQTFVDLLLSSTEQSSGEDEESSAVVTEESDEVVDLRRELADLRQANDTLASALGACPYCWGGDDCCRVCRGRGRPGYAPPDPDLFEELVVPAVQRARAKPRAGFRPGSRRERA